MSLIKVYSGHVEVKYEVINFPCGELQVRFTEYPTDLSSITMIASITDSDGIMQLMQLKACFDPSVRVVLMLSYLPYARQDRVCNKGECNSLKVFATLINSLGFAAVTLVDPHSTVAEPLFDNARSMSKEFIFDNFTELSNSLSSYDILIAPDYGASKEVQELAKKYELGFVQGYKERDPKTGQLTGFGIHGDVTGKNVLVVDDICDGGGTFVGLRDVLWSEGANQISLYVTHGCFTKGVSLITDQFDEVFTTNSFMQVDESTDKFGDINIKEECISILEVI